MEIVLFIPGTDWLLRGGEGGRGVGGIGKRRSDILAPSGLDLQEYFVWKKLPGYSTYPYLNMNTLHRYIFKFTMYNVLSDLVTRIPIPTGPG